MRLGLISFGAVAIASAASVLHHGKRADDEPVHFWLKGTVTSTDHPDAGDVFTLTVCPRTLQGKIVLCASKGTPNVGNTQNGDFYLKPAALSSPAVTYETHGSFGYVSTDIKNHRYSLRNNSVPVTNGEYPDIIFWNAVLERADGTAHNSPDLPLLFAAEPDGTLVNAQDTGDQWWICSENWSDTPADNFNVLAFPSWIDIDKHYQPHSCHFQIQLAQVLHPDIHGSTSDYLHSTTVVVGY